MLVFPIKVINTNFSDYQFQGKLEKPQPITRRNLEIKNFRGQPLVSEHCIAEAIGHFSKKLQNLFHQEHPDLSLEELYKTAENLVFLDQKNEIFQILQNINKRFLTTKLENLLQINCPDKLLTVLTNLWNVYIKKIILVKNIYLWHDRWQNQFKFNETQATCLELFKSIIILSPDITNQITQKVLQEISLERTGHTIDRNRLSTMLNVLIDLKVYDDIFEERFLKESREFYRLEGRCIGDQIMTVKDYLRFVQKKIDEEIGRSYVFKDTQEKCLEILYEELIQLHENQILSQGFRLLMDEPCVPTLKLLYTFFIKGPTGLLNICRHFQCYLDDVCFCIVRDGTDKQMIQVLIDFKDKMDMIVEECFENNSMFASLIRVSYVKAINVRSSESALYLAKYLDSKLRAKAVTEDELKEALGKVMVIFRCIDGKDLFEAFYRKFLAKRLIFNRSTNQDVEDSIIFKLQEECGECFTSKIKGMLTDVDSSQTINSNFKEFLSNTHPQLAHKCDLSVLVLTSSFWTRYTSNLMVVLPDELLNYQAIFSKYYGSIHTGRKLDWQPNLGHCVVKGYFDSTVKELLVSMFQAIILLLFNEHSKLSLLEIQEFTKLDFKELIPTLHSLVYGKTQILMKEPQDCTIMKEDTFKLNINFTDKLSRIRVNQVQLKDNIEELKAAERSVFVDRQLQIDAAIVRILKNKKVMKHNDLMSELFTILDIPMKSQDLKKRIETLIEREYIQRDLDNSATYTYIA